MSLSSSPSELWGPFELFWTLRRPWTSLHPRPWGPPWGEVSYEFHRPKEYDYNYFYNIVIQLLVIILITMNLYYCLIYSIIYYDCCNNIVIQLVIHHMNYFYRNSTVLWLYRIFSENRKVESYLYNNSYRPNIYYLYSNSYCYTYIRELQ